METFTGLLYREDNPCLFSPDSGHGELYFENGKIKQKNDWKQKQVVSSKVWNEKGVLIKDIDFPKYIKENWDNGKPKGVMKGILYKDNRGVVLVDSGREEIYFENGKIKRINDWKDKQPITQKIWNEKGVLIQDVEFPKHLKEYWDNGRPKTIATGSFYRDEQDGFLLDSGHSEAYFENGKIKHPDDTYICAIDPFIASGEMGFDAFRPLPKETLLKHNKLVKIKDLFIEAIIEAEKKYAPGSAYPTFKLRDL